MRLIKFAATLTAALMVSFSATGQSARLDILDADVAYPEGPLWTDEGLYYVSYAQDQVLHWDGQRRSLLWEAPSGAPFTRCGPASLVQRTNGHLLLSCYDTGSLVEIDLNGKEIARYDADNLGKGFLGPNDFVRDASGGIYFSASGAFELEAPAQGSIYYLSVDNSIVEATPDSRIRYANGLALSPDGRRLLVSEHLNNRILSFAIHGPGVLGEPTVWALLPGFAASGPRTPKLGPDGLEFGPMSGFLYVCQYGASRILVLDEAGQLQKTLEFPYPYVTNVSFEGDDESTLYVTVEADADSSTYSYHGFLYRMSREKPR